MNYNKRFKRDSQRVAFLSCVGFCDYGVMRKVGSGVGCPLSGRYAQSILGRSMSIESIVETTWPEILKLQAEVYHLVEPESLEVLRDKWLRSPSSCFTYRDDEQLIGYLLAHSWNSRTPPKLFNKLPKGTEGSILFLHDLAVSNHTFGKGIGSKMIEHLVNVATASGYKEILLVSVQNSMQFWQKQGFTIVEQEVCNSYGDSAQLMKRVLLA
ncbi:GNAT family N-acetyltransferase [Vibrio cholerae]